MNYKSLLICIAVFSGISLFGQDKMESIAPNFSTFTSSIKADLAELEKFSSSKTHPEFGTLPYNAPCKDCIEVLEERTQYSRKYLTVGKNGKEFLIQKGYSPLHYKNDAGEWATFDPNLNKINQNLYQTDNPYYDIEINTQSGLISFTNNRKNFQKLTFHNNLSLEFLNENGDVINSVPSNWSTHVAGDAGVKIINIFPNVDLEIFIRRDVIKTNFIIKSDLGGKFRIKEKINGSFKSRLANNENKLSVLNFFENGNASYSIGEIRIFGENTKNRKVLQGHYEVNGDYLTYNWDTDEYANLSYPIIIDPTVTSAGTLPQASFTDSGLNNAGAFTNACTYNLTVATPPNCEITDIDWTASYLAQNGATMSEGAFRFNYGACVSPSGVGFFWFCNNTIFGGTCNGANISIFTDFQSCVPAPQCTSYNMDFTLEFFDAFAGASCSSTFITSDSDWTMTITGETVDEPAPPTSSNGTSICPGSSTTLNANGVFGVPGYTYSWSPSTNLDDPNVQSPVFTAPGTSGSTNYVCTITDACGNTSTNNINITVVNGPNAGSDGTLTICATDPSVDLTLSLGGSPDSGGDWSPLLNSGTDTFDPSVDGSGTYTYTVQDSPGPPNCPDHTAEVVVTVTTGIIPTFAAVGPYCNGDAIPALPTTSTNAITGTWAPAINNTTTTNYTFTPTAGQCATTTTLTITITPSTTPVFVAVGPYCDGDAIPALPTTSTNGINGTWGPAIDNTTTTNYTFTPTAGQCASTQTLTITITPQTTPTFAAVGPYCDGTAIPALPTTSTNGINGTWAPAINNTTTTNYTFTPTAGQCATTQTLTITITPSTTPTFAAVGPYCDGDVIPALPTTSTNGINGTWAPAINNTTTTNYTFTPTAGQCATAQTLTITITPQTTPTFAAVGPYCDGDAIPALPTTSTNGINGTWAPAINNTTTTNYTFTPTAGQCATAQILTITITPQTTPTFAAVGPYCDGTAIPALPTTSTNGINGTWAPAIDNTTTTNYTFTPTAGQCATAQTLTITITTGVTPTFAAVGPYCDGDVIPALPTTSTNAITGTWAPAIDNTTTTSYTFTPDVGQCGTVTTLTITITPNTTPTFVAVGPYCDGDVIPALPTTSTNGVNGTWAPAIDNTTTTTYTFTPSAGQCAIAATLTITISPNVTPTFTAVGPYCDGDVIPALPTTSTNGINGSWAPAIDNTTTTTYTFTPTAGQCATAQTLTITITPNVTPIFATVGPYCDGDAIPALPTTSTNAVTGTWAPAIDNTTTTTYTFTPTAGQCATAQTVTITITPSTTPTFTAVGPFCDGDVIPALPTTSTNAITGTWAPAIDNTTTTTYTFTPTAGQCATVITLTITVNPLPVIALEGFTNITNCLAPDGTITITANGTSYELFDISNTSISTNATGSFININAGDYYVVITLNSCTTTSSTFTITNASAPVAPVAGTDATYCDGDALTDLFGTAAAGGTINWYSDAGLTTNIGTGGTLTPSNTIGATIYYVTETVSNCESPASSVTITINAIPTAPSAGTDATYCNGDLITDITTTATSPNWYSDAGLTTNLGSGTTLAPSNTIGATIYYVTETTNGCESLASMVTITINDNPAISTEGFTNITDCLNPDGSITITANGASYELFDISNTSISTNVSGNFTGLNVGDYYVVVTLNGCTTTSSTYTISNALAPSAPVAGTDATYCDGDALVDLFATAAAGGSINWYSDAGLTNNIGTTGTLTPPNTVGATIYYVTETVSNCESPASSVTITINPIPTAPVAGTDATYCNGDPLVDLTTNSTSPSWYSDAGLTTTIGSGTTLTPGNTIGATIYYVTETTNGCESLASTVTVTINDTPTITSEVATDMTSCVNDNGTVTITSAGTSFELFTLAGMSVSTNATGIFINLPVGSYYVVVSNGNCSVTGTTLAIVDVTSPTTQTFNNSICSGSDYTYADGTVHTNITINETYTSTLTSTIGCDSIIIENLTVVQNITVVIDTTICEGTNYTSVGDAANFTNVLNDFTHTSTVTGTNGCDSIIIENITVTPSALIDLGPDLTICPGETITIDAITNTGVPIWNTGDTTLSLTVTITTDTFFVAAVTGSCGNAFDTIFISVFPPFTVDAGPDVTIPLGATTQLEATGANSYTWSPSMFLDCSTCASPISGPTDDITYIVTGYDENGCTQTDTVTVIIDGEITIYFPNIFTPNGDGENDTFGPYGPTFTTFIMQIYNRWGGLVYETEIPGERWDGRKKGDEECPQAVFTYRVKGMLVNGQIVEKAGNVMLAR